MTLTPVCANAEVPDRPGEKSFSLVSELKFYFYFLICVLGVIDYGNNHGYFFNKIVGEVFPKLLLLFYTVV